MFTLYLRVIIYTCLHMGVCVSHCARAMSIRSNLRSVIMTLMARDYHNYLPADRGRQPPSEIMTLRDHDNIHWPPTRSLQHGRDGRRFGRWPISEGCWVGLTGQWRERGASVSALPAPRKYNRTEELKGSLTPCSVAVCGGLTYRHGHR